jgi:hypothetical protein
LAETRLAQAVADLEHPTIVVPIRPSSGSHKVP